MQDSDRWKKMVKPDLGLSWGKAIGWSCLFHAFSPFIFGCILLLVLVFAAWLLHVDWRDWFWHKKQKQPDMEFVLVKKSQAPPPQVFQHFSAFNQQAGGVSKKPPAQVEEKTPVPHESPKETSENTIPEDKTKESLEKPLEQPSAQPANDSMSIPGSPEEGEASTPGIAVSQTAFAPYFKDLNQKFQRNWRPPRGKASEKVVVQFQIGRDGRLINTSIYETSGSTELDEAAIAAVEHSAPFQPLPETYPQESISLLFSFDYTILLGKKNKTRTQ